MRHAHALLLLLALDAAAAPVPFPRPPKPGSAKADLKAMQGEWVAVSCTTWVPDGPGKPGLLMSEAPAVRLVVAGDRLTQYQGDRVVGVYTVRLDASRSPRWVDAAAVPGRLQHSAGSKGLYRLEGDRLTICEVDCGKGGRPARIAGGEPWHILTVLRRVKK
jgi:uncharacterized protein (TIGR03067 family)